MINLDITLKDLDSSSNYDKFGSEKINGLEVESEENSGEILNFSSQLATFDFIKNSELEKNKIQNNLASYFKLQNEDLLIDFLLDNSIYTSLLPKIATILKQEFEEEIKLELELFSESDDWQTIFINAFSNKSWEESKEFEENLFLELYKLSPDLAKNLNLNIIPNEI